MSKIIFDLSGNKGLVDKFESDPNGESASNLRYQGDDGQLADGLFNPFKKSGLITASNTYYDTVTTSLMPGSFVYDADNNNVYLAELGTKIYSFSSTDSLTPTEVFNVGSDGMITDMDLYEVNGKKALVFANKYKEATQRIVVGSVLATRYDTWTKGGLLKQDSTPFAQSIAYGNNTFVVTTSSNVILKSKDGLVWTEGASQTGVDGGFIGFLNNRWIHAGRSGTGRIAFSYDLINWTTNTTGDGQQWEDGTYGNSTYVLVSNVASSKNVAYSTNGTSWTTILIAGADLRSVAYGAGLFVAVGNSGVIYSSPDGITWTSRTSPSVSTWASVTFGNGRFVAVADSGATRGMQSTDGITWTGISTFNAETMKQVKFGGGYFMAIGAGETIYKSTDGVTFTKIVSSGLSGMNGKVIAYGNGYFIASETGSVYTQTFISGTPTTYYSDTYNKTALGFYTLETNEGISTVDSRPKSVYPNSYDSYRVSWDNTGAYNGLYERLGQIINMQGSIDNKLETLRLGLSAGILEDTILKVNVHDGELPTDSIAYSSTITLTPSSSNVYKEYYVDFGTQAGLTSDFAVITIELQSTAGITQAGYFDWIATPANASLHQLTAVYFSGVWTIESAKNSSFDVSVIKKTAAKWTKEYITNSFEIDLENGENFIRKADNGFLYWFTDNKVHSVDGGITGTSVGILRKNLLVFPAYLKITDALDARSRMFIAIQSTLSQSDSIATNSNIVGVYVWDRLSAATNFRDFVAIPGVKEIKALFLDASNNINAICISNDRYVELRRYTGNEFQLYKTLGKKSYPSSNRGISTINNLSYWFGLDGYIYLYGSVKPGENKEVYKIAQLDSGLVSTGGVLTADNSPQQNNIGIYVGYKNATTEGVKIYRPNGSQFISGGNVKTRVELLPTLSTVKNIRALHAPDFRENIEFYEFQNGDTKEFTDGTSFTFADILDTEVLAELRCYMNMQVTPVWTRDITYADLKRGYIEKEWNKNNVNSVQFEIVWSGKTATLGEYQPMYLEVNYLDESRQLGR